MKTLKLKILKIFLWYFEFYYPKSRKCASFKLRKMYWKFIVFWTHNYEIILFKKTIELNIMYKQNFRKVTILGVVGFGWFADRLIGLFIYCGRWIRYPQISTSWDSILKQVLRATLMSPFVYISFIVLRSHLPAFNFSFALLFFVLIRDALFTYLVRKQFSVWEVFWSLREHIIQTISAELVTALLTAKQRHKYEWILIRNDPNATSHRQARHLNCNWIDIREKEIAT